MIKGLRDGLTFLLVVHNLLLFDKVKCSLCTCKDLTICSFHIKSGIFEVSTCIGASGA